MYSILLFSLQVYAMDIVHCQLVTPQSLGRSSVIVELAMMT